MLLNLLRPLTGSKGRCGLLGIGSALCWALSSNFSGVAQSVVPSEKDAIQRAVDQGSKDAIYVMNDISIAQFPDFEKKWRFVTSRYRTDTGEMRLTYANDIAWRTLERGTNDYPDNAVFAKIGLMTRGDPAFVSSKAPVGTRRFQFMVRDRARYSHHDGWGYALFDGDGKVFYGSMQGKTVAQVTDACHTCHKLVEHRGYVFSIPMNVSPGRPSAPLTTATLTVPFATVAASTLPSPVRPYIGSAAEVRLLQGGLQYHFFQGTLAEIQPTLAEEAARTGVPSALLLHERETVGFMVARVDDLDPDCRAARNKPGKRVQITYTWPYLTPQNIKSESQCEEVPE
jgi:Cytochrome P460